MTVLFMSNDANQFTLGLDLKNLPVGATGAQALGARCGLKVRSLPAGPRRDRPGLAGHC